MEWDTEDRVKQKGVGVGDTEKFGVGDGRLYPCLPPDHASVGNYTMTSWLLGYSKRTAAAACPVFISFLLYI